MELLWDKYRDWLLEEVGFVDYNFYIERPGHFAGPLYPHNFELLMRKLHDTEFEWILERDENRMKDGMALRYDFFDEQTDIEGGAFMRPASVLEVLVGLAVRLDCEYIGDPGSPHPEIIFWDMIKNLGLDKYNDAHFNEMYVEEIIENWLKRQYRSDGKGSIFKLKGDTFDCRNEEIWKLAMAYITENY